MYKNILHATDLSDNHFDLCQKSVALAKALGANIQFLHVIEIPASLQWAQSLGFAELSVPKKDNATLVMATLGEAFSIPTSKLHVEIGSAFHYILETIKELSCDLVILGSHSNTPLPAFLGSTAQAVIHHAVCDVLTMR